MHFVDSSLKMNEHFEWALSQALWGKDAPSSSEIKREAEKLKDLWKKLAVNRGQVLEDHYSFDSSFARAYAAYYLPANYMKVSLILREMSSLGLNFFEQDALKWVDLGCGPGTAFFGLSDYFENYCKQSNKKFEYVGLDQSMRFLEVAEKISRMLKQKIRHPQNPKFQKLSYLQTLTGGWPDSLLKEKPDVICMMNSLSEFQKDFEIRKKTFTDWMEQVSAHTKKTGKGIWLLLIEPGSKAATRELLGLRESIRAMEDVRIWLPCLSNRSCGALATQGDWCHEDAPLELPDWHNELGKHAGLKKESMLFSYQVISVGKVSIPQTWNENAVRMVSQRMQEKGLVKFYLCYPDQRRLGRVLHSRANENNEKLLEIKRGQLFESIDCEEKGDVIRFTDLKLR